MTKVSVIIPTLNEEKHIERCIESVINQPEKSVDITVIDNNSVDDTVALARIHGVRVLRYGLNRSEQINFGVRFCDGEYVLILDADMAISPSVITVCLHMCEQLKYDAVCIKEEIAGKGFWIKVRNFERSFYTGTCIDAVRFTRKSVLKAIGGYETNLTAADDWDFDRRVRSFCGKNVAICYQPIYHNEDNFSVSNYLRKKAGYSDGIIKYAEKWGWNDSIVKKQLGWRYRYFGVFFKNLGWTKLLKHPILTAGMYFLRFLVGLQYIKNIRRK